MRLTLLLSLTFLGLAGCVPQPTTTTYVTPATTTTTYTAFSGARDSLCHLACGYEREWHGLPWGSMHRSNFAFKECWCLTHRSYRQMMPTKRRRLSQQRRQRSWF
jgi:hypothetical protein